MATEETATEDTTFVFDEKLGTEFWTQPDSTLEEPMRLIYASLVAVFKEEIAENRGGLVDVLIAERAAFMYVYNRQRESAPGFNDRNRREMNKDLVDLLLTLKKLWSADKSQDAGEKALAKANKAIGQVLSDLPEHESVRLRRELASAFEAHGI